MTTKKHNQTGFNNKSLSNKNLRLYLSIIFLLLPFLGKAQIVYSPILDDPKNYTVFSFYPFESGGFTYDHKSYFHSLRNNIPDLTMPNMHTGMWFRLMFPNGYDINDTNTKYPLILFLHGAGERGTTNYRQLVHGGQIHRDAVLSGEFPGLLLYPQQNTGIGGWPANGTDNLVDQAFHIVKKLVKYYNVDPNRIYVHGLSGGGEGAWRSMIWYPDLVAAAFPMSNANYNEFVVNSTNRNKYKHIPMRLSQGGRDTAPPPQQANNSVRDLRNYGSSIIYHFMPTTGHSTWNTQYNKDDFFSWFLQYSKTSIHVFYEQAQYCEGQQFPSNLRLGVTDGYQGYEWAFNSTTNVIATGTNEIIATAYGDYYVRIRRGTEWSAWSEPRTIDTSRLPSPPPTITSGSASVTLPALDGSQSVRLSQTAGPTSNYQWYRDGGLVAGATNNNYTAAQQGDFTLTAKSPATPSVMYADYWNYTTNRPGPDGILDAYPSEYRAEPVGCESTPSNIVRVTTSNGPNSPLPPKNFFVFSRGPASNDLVFDDNSNNETGFEIYRSDDNGTTYHLISIQPPSDGSASITYSDNNLQANTQYCYRIRSVNGDGGSPYSEMVCASTGIDTTPPAIPILDVSFTTGTSISLSWVSSDNVEVTGYDLYRNGTFLISLTQNTYNNINLIPSTSYTYYVIAKDAAGNNSMPSNQVTAATVNTGLYYKYYHFDSDLSSVDQIESTTFIKAGKVSNFDITVRDRDDRFGFVFEGFINIPTTGSWRFYPYSDDGSKVYINGALVYSNDGPHGCGVYGSAISVSLTAGVHNIKVLYFENGGGQCLDVRWRLGSTTAVTIPDSAFENNFVFPDGPNPPTNLIANPVSFNEINLAWTDNSADETAFELHRRAFGQANYQIAGVTGSNVTSFSDTDLEPSTTYYYKILSRNNNGLSNQQFTSPSAYLNLNNDVIDVSENNLASSINGSPAFNENDKMEGSHSLQFTRSSGQRLNFDNGSVFVRRSFSNRAVSMWVKVTSELSGTQILYEEGGSTSGFAIRLNGSNLQVGVANGSSRTSTSASFTPYANIWTHIVGIYRAGTLELYINKNLVASSPTSFLTITGQNEGSGIGGTNSSNAFNVSSGSNTISFGGLIDNFMFFNSALSQAEIDHIYGTDFGYSKVQTLAPPATPAAPSNLAATPLSTSQISLSWTDNSTNELGFEIFRSTFDVESSYLLVATTAADATTYIDSELPGNTVFFYKIRAKGPLTNSAFTPSVSASPLNTPPVFTSTILNRSVQIGTTLEFEVRATDIDLDVVTFATDGDWPAFGSVSNIGQNKAMVRFENPTDFGTYNLRVSATDGYAVVYSNTFTITVNNNAVPIITSISDQQVKESKSLTVNISATDDSGQVTLSTVNLPSFATFNYSGNGGTASILFNPMVYQAGFYGDIQIIANDGQGGIAVETFNLVVEAIETSYTVNLSFDNVPRYELPWNFIGGTNFVIGANDVWPISNLFTSNQSQTPIIIDASEINAGSGSFDNNLSYGNNGPGVLGANLIPDDVIKNGLAGAASQNNKLIINGLEDILSYELNLMSSVRSGYGGTATWTTTFRINGISKTINPVGNATEFQRFVDVRPTNGIIEIEMLTSGGSRTMLNAFTLEAYYDDGTLPAAPSDLVLEALTSSSTLVKWKDNSTNETDFDIFRRSEFEQTFNLVGTVNRNSTSLLDQYEIYGTTRYFYYVRARNKNGFTDSQIFDVISRNASPVIAEVNTFTAKTGQKTSQPVFATDYENDAISLFINELPPFVTFIDNGNGTGYIITDPDESVVDQKFDLWLQAIDPNGGYDSLKVTFHVTNSIYQQTVYLNLTQNDILETAENWNNLIANPASTPSYANIKDSNGSNTTIGLSLSGTWSGQAADGLTYLNEAIFPANVMKSLWFTTGVGNITLTGLNPEMKYNISLFSSTDAPSVPENTNSVTTFTSGSISVNVDAFKNPNRLKKLSGLSPNPSGNITFSIQGSGGVRAVLNTIIIESYQVEAKPFAPTRVVAEVLAKPYTESTANPAPFDVILNWADNSGIETGFEIYRYDYALGSSTLIHTTAPNVQHFKDENIARDKKFGYRVRAINTSGVSEFATIADVTIPKHRILLNVNYYTIGNVALPGWNNTNASLPNTGWSMGGIKDDFNNDTDIEWRILSRENGEAGANFRGVNANGLYPAAATSSYFQIGIGDFNVYEWTGLDNNLLYNFVFFGSRVTGGVPLNGHTTYIVNEHSVSLNGWNNKDKSVVVKNLRPNNGSIQFSAGPSFPDGSNFGYINVLELQALGNYDAIYPKMYFHYYATDDTEISSIVNWTDNADGSGDNPTSFNLAGLTFVIPEGNHVNLANNLTIGGLGSKMIIKEDVVFNFSANNLTLNVPSLEIDEQASVTFTGTGLGTANIIIGNGGLNIRNGATLNIGNANVTVSGLGSVNPESTTGVIASDGGSINIANSSIQSSNLYFTSGASLNSLKIDNQNLSSLTIHDSIRITNKLEVTNGHLVTNGKIKLISDATNTAMITQVGATSTITGAVEYQRYWERSKGGYYYLGVPVHGQTLADWTTDFYIQGVQGRFPTYWTNVYGFNEPTNSWSAMNSVSNPVVPGKGIIALMFNSDFSDGYIRYTNVGVPVYGTHRVNLTYTDRIGASIQDEGWQLVANPYACAIDVDLIDWTTDANGLGSAVYLWNGATSMYETWTKGMGSKAVASGQGFFVKANGSTPNPFIDFRETHKVETNAAFLRTGELPNLLTFKMMNQDSVPDKFYIVVNQEATFGFESLYDAFKYKNSSHNIYLTDSSGNNLAVHSIPALRSQDTLRLNVESAASKSYKLQVSGLKSLERPVNMYLIDRYQNTTRLLNEGDIIPMAIDKNISDSYGQRFLLLVGQPGVVKLNNSLTRAGKTFKVPLWLGQLENVAEMSIGVRFNSADFKLNGLKIVNSLPGLTIDTTNAAQGIISIVKNSDTGIINLPDEREFVEFEFRPLVSKTGIYSIWVDPASVMKTSESVNYAVLFTDATIDVRSLRKLKGTIFDLKGRPFSNAIVQLKSDFELNTVTPLDGVYNFTIMDNMIYHVDVTGIEPDYSNPDLLDLIQMTRYIKKLEQIPSRDILYTSDLNNDEKANDADLIELQTLILSKQDKHPGKSVFKLQTGNDATRLTDNTVDYLDGVSFVADEDYTIDFLILRKGEVYRNPVGNARENRKSIDILYDLIPDSRENNILHLNLYMEEDLDMSGFELHIGIDNSDFEIVGIENLTEKSVFFSEFSDNTTHQLGLLWVSSEELSYSITNKKPFVKISLKSNGVSGSLIEEILEVRNNSKLVNSGYQINSIHGIIPRNFNESESKIIRLYPNPTNGELNVVVKSNAEDDYKFMFISSTGQILFEEIRHVFKGTNTINFNLISTQQYLAPGYYLLRTGNSKWTDVKPFLIK